MCRDSHTHSPPYPRLHKPKASTRTNTVVRIREQHGIEQNAARMKPRNPGFRSDDIVKPREGHSQAYYTGTGGLHPV